MTMRRWGSAGIGALAATALLLGASLFAAAPARAQQCDDAEEAAYEIFETFAEAYSEIADDLESDPSESDCAWICRATDSLCARETRLSYSLVKATIKSLTQVSKRLCETSANPITCKIDVKMVRNAGIAAAATARSLLIAACVDDDFTDACNDSCNQLPPFSIIPDCCEEMFYGVECEQ